MSEPSISFLWEFISIVLSLLFNNESIVGVSFSYSHCNSLVLMVDSIMSSAIFPYTHCKCSWLSVTIITVVIISFHCSHCTWLFIQNSSKFYRPTMDGLIVNVMLRCSLYLCVLKTALMCQKLQFSEMIEFIVNVMTSGFSLYLCIIKTAVMCHCNLRFFIVIVMFECH